MFQFFPSLQNRMMVFGAAGILATVAFVGSPAQAQDDDNQIAVGTLQTRQVFQNYDGRQQMMQKIREAQKEARNAQQNGNQQKARQAQQQMQQKRQQIMQKFRSNMQKAAQQVAQERNIDVVAPQVTYTSDRAQTQDITKPVTQTLNETVDTDDQQRERSLQLPGSDQKRDQQGQQNR